MFLNSFIKKLKSLDYKKYFFNNGLNKLFSKEMVDFDFNHKKLDKNFVFDNNNKSPFKPDLEDLIRLHYACRLRKVTTVLEIGSGYSTMIIAHALHMNRMQYGKYVKKNIRRANAFQIHTVDTKKKYLDIALKRIERKFKKNVFGYVSDARMSEIQGQICAELLVMPDITPDLIYCDGPCALDVKGNHSNISMHSIDRTIIISNFIKIESLLLPGTIIYWDGQTQCARFTASNFRRFWKFKHIPELDISLCEQSEPALGTYNEKQLKFCLNR
jgi:hypothetical protein